MRRGRNRRPMRSRARRTVRGRTSTTKTRFSGARTPRRGSFRSGIARRGRGNSRARRMYTGGIGRPSARRTGYSSGSPGGQSIRKPGMPMVHNMDRMANHTGNLRSQGKIPTFRREVDKFRHNSSWRINGIDRKGKISTSFNSGGRNALKSDGSPFWKKTS